MTILSKRNKLIIASISSLVAMSFLVAILLLALGIFNISASNYVAGEVKCQLKVVNNAGFVNGYMTDSSGNIYLTLDKGVTQRVVLEPSNLTGCQKALRTNVLQLTNSNTAVVEILNDRTVRLVDPEKTSLAIDLNISGVRTGATSQVAFNATDTVWPQKIFVSVVARPQ